MTAVDAAADAIVAGDAKVVVAVAIAGQVAIYRHRNMLRQGRLIRDLRAKRNPTNRLRRGLSRSVFRASRSPNTRIGECSRCRPHSDQLHASC